MTARRRRGHASPRAASDSDLDRALTPRRSWLRASPWRRSTGRRPYLIGSPNCSSHIRGGTLSRTSFKRRSRASDSPSPLGRMSSGSLDLLGKCRSCDRCRILRAISAVCPKGPIQSLRSLVIEIVEIAVDWRVAPKATVFQKRASGIRLRWENSRDRQVLAQRILTSPR